jgi:hypothetical protein
VNDLTIAGLTQKLPHSGELVWIGLTPARGEPMIIVNEVIAYPHPGLPGDLYIGVGYKRQVTLVQWEYLAVLGQFWTKRFLLNYYGEIW